MGWSETGWQGIHANVCHTRAQLPARGLHEGGQEAVHGCLAPLSKKKRSQVLALANLFFSEAFITWMH